MFCCTLLYVHSSIAIILMGKKELVALLNLSSWCLVIVERLFLAVPRGCLRFVIVVFPDQTHLLFLNIASCINQHSFTTASNAYGVSLAVFLILNVTSQLKRQHSFFRLSSNLASILAYTNNITFLVESCDCFLLLLTSAYNSLIIRHLGSVPVI